MTQKETFVEARAYYEHYRGLLEEIGQLKRALASQSARPMPTGTHNLRSFGADTSGTEDSTAAVQEAFTAATADNLGATVLGPPGTYKISDTVTIQSVLGLRFFGSGLATKFVWAGPADRPMFKIVDGRLCELSHFQIVAEAANPLLAAFQILNDGATSVHTAQDNSLHKIRIQGTAGHIYSGVIFGGTGATDANNDFNVLDDVEIYNYRDYAIEITHSQSYNNIFRNLRAGGGKQSIRVTNGGYFNLYGGFLFNNTEADITFNGPSSHNLPITIVGMTSEGSKRWLDCNTQTTGPHITAEGNRIAGNGIHADGEMVRLVQSAHIIMRNNVFNNGNTVIPMKFKYTPVTGLARHPGSSFEFCHNVIYEASATPANPFSSAYPTRQYSNKFQNESTLAAVAIDPTRGTTAQRPTYVADGFQYLDTTLAVPVWKDGVNWRDATGAAV